MTIILFPDNYFCNDKPDSEYEAECLAARDEKFDIAYLSNDALDNNKIRLNMDNSCHGDVIYRGWMLKPELYELLHQSLIKRGCRLNTSPEMYRMFHTLPGYYSLIESDTPKTIWFNYGEIDWGLVRKMMKKCMVKDFVKSVKETEFPTFLDLNAFNDNALNAYIEKFVELRDNLFTGGIVLKEYVDLKQYGDTTNEYRAFYFNHRVLSVSQNSHQPTDAAMVPHELTKKYCMDGFYTIDFAEKSDGGWVVIECGDGQVSGLPETLTPKEFYHRLIKLL